MAMRTIRLTVEYDGSEFAGWQFQPRLRTVQGEIEKALKRITKKKTGIIAAGRTDSGVHALGQVAHFKVDSRLPAKKFSDALNYYLGGDILIRNSEEMPPEFHARYDAAYRLYRYLISASRSAIDRSRFWELPVDLDREKLSWAADYIEGEHDFAAFCVAASRKKDNRCLVYRSRWLIKDDFLCYEIMANRFLHTMIRSLVGLMVQLGQGRISKKEFIKIFENHDHSRLGRVAPSRGLYLVAVGY